MGITQFDIIRQQAKAAAKNAVSRASASLRRDTSLVNQASRLTGKAIREGEAAVKRAAGRDRRRTAGEPRATAAADRPRPRQAAEHIEDEELDIQFAVYEAEAVHAPPPWVSAHIIAQFPRRVQ